jgi:hypothetical protein
MLEGLGFNRLSNTLEIQAFFDSIFLGPIGCLDIQWGRLVPLPLLTHFTSRNFWVIFHPAHSRSLIFYPFHLKGLLGNFVNAREVFFRQDLLDLWDFLASCLSPKGRTPYPVHPVDPVSPLFTHFIPRNFWVNFRCTPYWPEAKIRNPHSA